MQNYSTIYQWWREDRFFPISALTEAIGNNRALSYLNDLIELNPENTQAYVLRGNFYEEMDEPGQAMSDYDKAISLDPEYADAYCKRSSLCSEQKDYVQAANDADKALLLSPGLMLAHVNRAVAYTALCRDRDAERDVAAAIERGYEPSQLLEEIDRLVWERGNTNTNSLYRLRE